MRLHEIVDATTQFIDVRTEEEFATGHIDGASNIPLAAIIARKNEIKGLGVKPVVFYCRSGSRSELAVNYLKQLGYNHIHNGGSLNDVRKLVAKTNR